MIGIEKIKQFITLIHPTDAKISQKFGENSFKMFINGKWVGYKELFGMTGHNGIDYGCPTGSSLVMPCDAEIADCYYDTQDAGYGTNVIARSKPFDIDGKTYCVEMVFGHLKGFSVKKGQWVDQGQPFAVSNNTGKYTTGPHLHWGCRLVQKTAVGGWLAVDRDNGYLGYFDQLPLIDYSYQLDQYDGKIVYTGNQNGAMHYLVKDGQLLWVTDEVAYAIGGWTFKEAIQVKSFIINNSPRGVYEVDKNSQQYKVVKLLLGLLKDNPSRVQELYKKHF